MAKQKMIEIDGAALEAEFAKRNIPLDVASKTLCCSGYYLNGIIKAGKIPKTKVDGIEYHFGIEPRKYVVTGETQLELESVPVGNDFDDVVKELVKIRQALECLCMASGIYPEWTKGGQE